MREERARFDTRTFCNLCNLACIASCRFHVANRLALTSEGSDLLLSDVLILNYTLM
jgi:hypothetical protein